MRAIVVRNDGTPAGSGASARLVRNVSSLEVSDIFLFLVFVMGCFESLCIDIYVDLGETGICGKFV